MSNIKKFIKKEREKEAAIILALQNTIRLTAEKAVQLLFFLKMSELKESISNITFDGINYIQMKLVESIRENEELFEKLASIYSIEGDRIVTDQEKYQRFIEELGEHISIEKMVRIYEGYDAKEHKMETLLEGARIINSVASGEEYTIKGSGEEKGNGDY
jgi:hypothetical protein